MASRSKEKRELSPEEKAVCLAEARKFDAEAEQFKAVTRYKNAEANNAELVVELQRIDLEQKQRQYSEIKANNKYNQVYHFIGEVDDMSVKACMNQLDIWTRVDRNTPITIIFTSPGGSIVAGLALFDYIQNLKKQGQKFTTVSLGYAASMAGILLQAGNERVLGREAWVLIHEASFLAYGKIGEVEDTVEWIKRVCERIVDIFASRASEKTGTNKSKIASFIRKNWKRKDWWLSSEECLKYGFVDEIQ